MHFDFGFFSSLLLIFFVHGLVYACLLFRKGMVQETRSDKWLAFFLLLCVSYISAWMLGFAGWYDTQPYRNFLFYFPTQHLFLIGPVIFFYVQSLLNPHFTLHRKNWWHFLPGMLYILLHLVMVITDQVILKRYWFLASQADPDFDQVYQLVGFASMLLYCLAAIRYFQLYKKLMVQVVSYADHLMFKWIRNFLWAFVAMLFVQALFYFLSIPFPVLNGYVGSWWYFLCFALIFYYIAIAGYSNTIETAIPIRINLLDTHRQMLLMPNLSVQNNQPDDRMIFEEVEVIEIDAPEQEPGETKESTANEWTQPLVQLMESDRLFEDPELTLAQVAKQLNSNSSIISKAINQGFQLNFNDFVNGYRIRAVQQMLMQGYQQTQTLLGIALECGFNSKATFNRAFKKYTGLSPKDWIAQHCPS